MRNMFLWSAACLLLVGSVCGCSAQTGKVGEVDKTVVKSVDVGEVESVTKDAIGAASDAVSDGVDALVGDGFVQPAHKDALDALSESSSLDVEGVSAVPLTVVATHVGESGEIDHYVVLARLEAEGAGGEDSGADAQYAIVDYDLDGHAIGEIVEGTAQAKASVRVISASTLTFDNLASSAFTSDNPFFLASDDVTDGWQIEQVGETGMPLVNVELQDAVDAFIGSLLPAGGVENVVYGPVGEDADGNTVYIAENFDPSLEQLPVFMFVHVRGGEDGASVADGEFLDLYGYVEAFGK